VNLWTTTKAGKKWSAKCRQTIEWAIYRMEVVMLIDYETEEIRGTNVRKLLTRCPIDEYVLIGCFECDQCEYNQGYINGVGINKVDCAYTEPFEILERKVIEWGEIVGLNSGSSIEKQLLKGVEEMGELCGAVLRGNRKKIIDGFGDTLVTLILAHNHFRNKSEKSIANCLKVAYEEIKDRTGKMKNGNFVKEGDDS